MDKIDIQKLRELPIEGVASRLGLDVKRHACLCPYHDDHTPSMRFNVAKNTFKCFVCGAHGGVIDLALKLLPSTGRSGGVSFLDACHWLANENNIILTEYKPSPLTSHPSPKRVFDPSRYARFFEHPFLNDAAIKFLYKERHLDPRVVRWCKLNSYTDRNRVPWLQIPYFDIDGNLIGVQSRYLGKDKSQPRFRFPNGTQCHIYNLPVLKMLKKDEPLYVSEGCSDCWALLSAGHKAIAIPSATLLKAEDCEVLRGLNLHMYPDNDAPGEKVYRQLAGITVTLGACLTRHSLPPGCKDYSDFYLLNH